MGKIAAKQVSVSVGEKDILKDCSFTVQEGECVGIIGPNGSGKTTFLKALRGIIPSTGEIRLNDKLISEQKDKEIARQVAYMQQSVEVNFGYKVEDIVMAARYPYLKWWEHEGQGDREKVQAAMRFVGIDHMKEQDVTLLSGGERQRVFLAKALAQETDILLLDEPTAALDLVYAEEIFRHCEGICKQGKTVVIVVHDIELAAKFCTRLVLFSKGRIVGDGKPHDVLTAENLKKSFHLSSTVYEDAYFNQLRIFIYPNGEENIDRYRTGHSPLPEMATTAIVTERHSVHE